MLYEKPAAKMYPFSKAAVLRGKGARPPSQSLAPTAPNELFGECNWTPGIKKLVIKNR